MYLYTYNKYYLIYYGFYNIKKKKKNYFSEFEFFFFKFKFIYLRKYYVGIRGNFLSFLI